MSRGVFACLIAIINITSVASYAQIVRWDILRPQSLNDSGTWAYYSISACDDHNYVAAANFFTPQNNQPFVVRTTDGGITWTPQNPNIVIEYDPRWKAVRTVYMIDSLHVIGIGDSGLIARTSDGGQTWIRQDFATPGLLTSIHFYDSQTGIIAGGGGTILITSNGGVDWTAINGVDYGALESCHAYGNGKFRAFNFSNGFLYTTTDNWQSWDSLPVSAQADTTKGFNGITACDFLGQDSILAIGALPTRQNGIISKIFLSTDGGKSYSIELNQITYTLPYHIATGFNNLWVAGGLYDGTLYSTNQGSMWINDSAALISAKPYTWAEIFAVQAVSPAKVIAVLGNEAGGYIAELDLTSLSVGKNALSPWVMATYPNPADKFVQLASGLGEGELHISDILGRDQIVQKLNYSGTTRIDVSKLPAGAYFVNAPLNGQIVHFCNLIISR